MAFCFEVNVKDASVLLKSVADELKTEDMNQAGRILRAVLHTIRDTLPVKEAIRFSTQLPILWKGIFFDHYDPEKAPASINSRQGWLNYIRSKNAFAANSDFQQDEEIEHAAQAVFRALQSYVPDEQLQEVKKSLHQATHTSLAI